MALPARDYRAGLDAAAALTRAYRDAKAYDVKAEAVTNDAAKQLLSYPLGSLLEGASRDRLLKVLAFRATMGSAAFLLVAKGLACKPAR